jgi:hypothetical protein
VQELPFDVVYEDLHYEHWVKKVVEREGEHQIVQGQGAKDK